MIENNNVENIESQNIEDINMENIESIENIVDTDPSLKKNKKS